MSFEKGQYDVALGRVLRFLSQKDLWTCSLVNKTWNQLAKSELWRQPKFGTGSSTSIQSFRQFLKTLENAGGETKSLIKVMDVSQVQESLYETIDDNWLTMILQNCPHLRSLIIRDTSFLTTTSNMITNDSADRKSALKEVMIYRAKYESDFILGGYTKTSMKNFEKDDEEVSEGWVRKFNVQHPSGPKIKLTLLD
ncbi:4786_t:CDS:2, partial [Acaulospora colombiana]